MIYDMLINQILKIIPYSFDLATNSERIDYPEKLSQKYYLGKPREIYLNTPKYTKINLNIPNIW